METQKTRRELIMLEAEAGSISRSPFPNKLPLFLTPPLNSLFLREASLTPISIVFQAEKVNIQSGQLYLFSKSSTTVGKDR